jgi:type VI secretion system secreted protein Hcp
MSNNMFMKFTGGPVTIEGETQDSDHKKWVDIESFSWGAHHPASFEHGSGGATAAAQASELVISKKVDSASPGLFKALFDASHVETVELELMKVSSGGTKFAWYKLKMSPVMITSLSTSGSGENFESVSLAFGKMEFTYTPQDDKGEPMGEKMVEYNYQEAA